VLFLLKNLMNLMVSVLLFSVSRTLFVVLISVLFPDFVSFNQHCFILLSVRNLFFVPVSPQKYSIYLFFARFFVFTDLINPTTT